MKFKEYINEGLSSKEQYKYAYGVIKLNYDKFNKSEKKYYSGTTGKMPHGIDDKVWKKAWGDFKKEEK